MYLLDIILDESQQAQIATIAAVGGLIGFVFSIFILVCMWKIFAKAGRPGWASLIPIYNIWVLCEMTTGKGWLAIITMIFPPLVLYIYYALNKVFGGTTLTFILLLLFPWFMLPVLAFSSAEYTEPA